MEILRYTAFSTVPDGGNPAGVVLDARGTDDATMQRVAAEVGYSETAFLLPGADPGEVAVRYFSPLAEVPFCGHATIASAVAHAERHGPGPLRYATPVGPVEVRTEVGADGVVTATLVSVPPRTAHLSPVDLDELLDALDWLRDDLHPGLPPRVAFAGAWHPILVARTRERLAALDYDYDRLAALMAAHGWTTVALVHRESPTVFHARNPFPPGGVVEDPATGAAAAALGGYLRELRLVEPPVTITVHQGDDMGRPSRLLVDLDPGQAAVQVTGGAVRIPHA